MGVRRRVCGVGCARAGVCGACRGRSHNTDYTEDGEGCSGGCAGGHLSPGHVVWPEFPGGSEVAFPGVGGLLRLQRPRGHCRSCPGTRWAGGGGVSRPASHSPQWACPPASRAFPGLPSTPKGFWKDPPHQPPGNEPDAPPISEEIPAQPNQGLPADHGSTSGHPCRRNGGQAKTRPCKASGALQVGGGPEGAGALVCPLSREQGED